MSIMEIRRQGTRRQKTLPTLRKPTLEFVPVPRVKGSSAITINVKRAGAPYGQIWTYENRPGERHKWHAKPINGEVKTFATAEAAQNWMQEIS